MIPRLFALNASFPNDVLPKTDSPNDQFALYEFALKLVLGKLAY